MIDRAGEGVADDKDNMYLFTATVAPEFEGALTPQNKWDYIVASCHVFNEPENLTKIPCEIEYKTDNLWLVSVTSITLGDMVNSLVPNYRMIIIKIKISAHIRPQSLKPYSIATNNIDQKYDGPEYQ